MERWSWGAVERRSGGAGERRTSRTVKRRRVGVDDLWNGGAK